MFGIKTILATLFLATVPPSQDATLIFVTTPGCGPCRQIAPLVEEIAKEGYSVEIVDASTHPDIVRQLQVDRFPTFLMLSNDRIIDKVVGGGDPLVMKPRIINMFDRAVELKRKNSSANAPVVRSSVPEKAEFQLQSASSAIQTSIVPDSKSTNIFTEHAHASLLATEKASDLTTVPASIASGSADSGISSLITSSVKLRVDAQNAHSWGTGTIVDARNGEALILTCGHIFRDSKGQNPIEVHLFGPQSTAKVYGRCIHYDLEIDLAFIAIAPPFPVRAIPIAPTQYRLRNDQHVWSVGCDGGANPTVKNHEIMSLDRIRTAHENAMPFHYIQVSGAPVSGRSGGGLFTKEGYLVGVCNTGDPEKNDGHFVPPDVIRQVLHKMKLDIVYEKPSLVDQSMLAQSFKESQNQVAQVSVAPAFSQTEIASSEMVSSAPNSLPNLSSESIAQVASPLPKIADNRLAATTVPEKGMSDIEQATLDEIKRRTQDGDEVILIVRSRRNPEIPSDVIILNGTSDQFLNALAKPSFDAKSPNYDPVILTSHDSVQKTLQPMKPLSAEMPNGPQEVSHPVQHLAFPR